MVQGFELTGLLNQFSVTRAPERPLSRSLRCSESEGKLHRQLGL
jgi:hypothetical protein